jgi:hypothetical protein
MDESISPLPRQAPSTPLPVRSPVNAHPPKARPDARPMRIALGAGGLAAFSALMTAIVLPPSPAVVITTDSQQAVGPAAAGTPLQVQRPVRYIQLQPGQTAPPGANVIDAAAAQPITVVTTVPAPAQKPIYVKTTQSGKVVK